MSEPAPPNHKGNLFFQVLVISVSIFILTIFALIAAVIGESKAPLFRLINEQAGLLILSEVFVIMFACVLAMVIDRRQAVRRETSSAGDGQFRSQHSSEAGSESTAESTPIPSKDHPA